MGVIKPEHPEANMTPFDVEYDLTVTAFAGPEPDIEWVQLSIGDKSIRLSPRSIFELTLLLMRRLDGNVTGITKETTGGKQLTGDMDEDELIANIKIVKRD